MWQREKILLLARSFALRPTTATDLLPVDILHASGRREKARREREKRRKRLRAGVEPRRKGGSEGEGARGGMLGAISSSPDL